MPAGNWRFGASGGVAPQKMKWEIERYYPAGSAVEAATAPSRWNDICININKIKIRVIRVIRVPIFD